MLRYARERGLPAVALNVSNPYGPLDCQPNQGLMVKLAAQGQIPVWVKGVSTEVVGIEDVAEAFLLAAEHGRVGERYIISETYMPMRELLRPLRRSRCATAALRHSAGGDVRRGLPSTEWCPDCCDGIP